LLPHASRGTPDHHQLTAEGQRFLHQKTEAAPADIQQLPFPVGDIGLEIFQSGETDKQVLGNPFLLTPLPARMLLLDHGVLFPCAITPAPPKSFLLFYMFFQKRSNPLVEMNIFQKTGGHPIISQRGGWP
jgi:hypothetical protein